jgi:hypothetical protein
LTEEQVVRIVKALDSGADWSAKVKKAAERKVLGSLLAVVLFLLLAVSLLPPMALAAGATYTTFDFYADRDISRISVMSDVHLGETTSTRTRFAALMQAIDQSGFDPQMLVVCGDTYTGSYSPPSTNVYAGTTIGTSFSSSYDEIRAVAEYYLGEDIPIVNIPGNHDWEMGSTYFTSNSGYSAYYGRVPTRNFDVFMLGAPNSGAGGYNYSTDEIDALDTYLSDRDETDKPVFVAAHYPLDDTETFPHGNAGNASAVQAVLAAYDQPIVFLWGHNHNAPRTSMEQLIKHYESGYTTANAGAINFRTTTDIAQGLNLTIDLDDHELDYSVIRIDTDLPGQSTVFGTGSQPLPVWPPVGDTYSLLLHSGWNLVASAPGTVFPGVLFGWNGGAYESVTSCASWHGYWCKMAEEQATMIQTTVPTTPYSMGVVDGWNLIGNSTRYSAGLTLETGRVAFIYNAAAGQYESVLTLLPGQGAWVRGGVGEEASLTPIIP